MYWLVLVEWKTSVRVIWRENFSRGVASANYHSEDRSALIVNSLSLFLAITVHLKASLTPLLSIECSLSPNERS
jgi:hypothetical protein